jgi:hypothetical protein
MDHDESFKSGFILGQHEMMKRIEVYLRNQEYMVLEVKKMQKDLGQWVYKNDTPS